MLLCFYLFSSILLLYHLFTYRLFSAWNVTIRQFADTGIRALLSLSFWRQMMFMFVRLRNDFFFLKNNRLFLLLFVYFVYLFYFSREIFSTFTSNYTPLDWIIGFQIARNKTSTANQNFFSQTVNGSFINIDFIHQISKTVDSFFTMAPYEFIASDVGDKIKNPFCLLWMQCL